MSSGFISEAELAEVRKQRQEEWEKVRQPNEPLEKPEEPYDARSLYERLKEQKDKKDLEFEETHKLKNLIRGLDDDEVDFLNIIDQAKMDAEKKQLIEENKELLEFRQRVTSLQEMSMNQKINTQKALPKPTAKLSNRPSQKSIMAGLVRKRPAGTEESNGRSGGSSNIPSKISKEEIKTLKTDTVEIKDRSKEEKKHDPVVIDVAATEAAALNDGALKCIGILPGLGGYKESSDSEKSTDTDDDYDFSNFDWVGRKIKKDSEHEGCH